MHLAQRLCSWYLGAITLLLPLKFGLLAGSVEATSFFPDTLFGYLLVAWPPASFGVAAGIGLLWAVLVFPLPAFDRKREDLWTVLLWGVGLPLVALLGIVNATTWDFSVLILIHLFGVAAYLWAMFLCFSALPVWRKRFVTLLVVGVFLTIYQALEQYFVSLEATRELVARMQAEGAEVPPPLRARVADNRVFSPFTASSSLAAYLLLLLPLTGYWLYRACERIREQRAARLLLVPLGLALLLWVLLLTKSRAAFLTLVAGVGAGALLWPWPRRWKILLLVLAVLTVGAGAWYIHHRGRGFESMAARGDYIRSSLILLVEHPLAGAGWGEFFHRHMQLKSIQSNEAAHDPHNLVLSFASQCGVPGLLAILLALGYPWWRLWLRVVRAYREAGRLPGLETAALAGVSLFFLHSLMDVNFLVAALLATAAGLLLALLGPESGAEAQPEPPRSKCRGRAAQAAGLLLALGTAGAAVWELRGEYAYDRLLSLTAPEGRQLPPTRKQVERQFELARMRRPYSAFPWSVLGDYYMRNELRAEAARCYQEALQRAPSRSFLYLRLFRLALERGDREEALKQLRRVYELFPGHPDHVNLIRRYAPQWLEAK